MIILDENHRLTSDKHQFIIQKKMINDDKESKNYREEYWVNDAYVPKIEYVLRYMINNKIKENINDVEKIVSSVQSLESKFEDLLKAKRL